MPFNGSGTFNRVHRWADDSANGIDITDTRMDAEDDGFATGLSNCITRDGQSPPSAAIDWGNQNLTGVANLGVGGNATITGNASIGGNISATGHAVVTSPNNGSTGAVQIKDAPGDPNAAYLQFVNNSGITQLATIRGLQGGGIGFAVGAVGESLFLHADGRLIAGTNNVTFDATVPAQANIYGVASALALKASGTSNTIASFYNDTGSTRVGWIGTSGSTTSYSTTSDYRLKENVAPLTGALDRLLAIPVHRFNFISTPGHKVDGFLAHEVAAQVPEAVQGEKDGMEDIGRAVREDGEGEFVDVTEAHCPEGWTWTKTGTRPVYQGIDQSKLVPLLLAAIQELTVRVAALESRL